MTTQRQIDANRRNAQKSTGPKTPEGKARSRRNALKHGLSGAGAVLSLDDHDEIAERLESWRPSYRPETPQAEWYFRQLIVSSVRIDRCQRDEAVQLQYLSRRASGCWDDDRRAEAESLAVGLSAKPALTAAKLRLSKHGALWLVDRWRGLAEAAEQSGGAWTETQEALAFDLLGTPPDRRTRAPWSEPDTPLTFAHRAADGLERLIESLLDGLDQFAREAAGFGLPVEPSKALALARRYEAASLRRHQWASNRLRDCQADAPPAPEDRREARRRAESDALHAFPARPPMTDDEWREYEWSLLRRYMQPKAPAAPTPPAVVAPPAEPPVPPPAEPPVPPPAVARSASRPAPTPDRPTRSKLTIVPETPPLNRHQRRAERKIARRGENPERQSKPMGVQAI